MLLALLSIFASCRKTDEAPVDDSVTTNLNVVNATVDTLNYYLNGTRINNTSSIYPYGSSGYVGVVVGEQIFQFKKYRNASVLFDLPLALDTNKRYSVYVAGSTAGDTFTSIDTLKADTLNRAMLRFVNATPTAGTVDVMVGDTVKFNVRAYKSVSVFLPVGPGLKRIRVYQSGSTTAIADTTRLITGRRVYTLFTKGDLKGTGGCKFGTALFVNQ